MATEEHALVAASMPGDEQLRQAEAEYAGVEALLIEAELRLATLKQQLRVFEQLYRRVAAGLCEELSELGAQVDMLCAQKLLQHERPERPRVDGHRARAAQASASATTPPEFLPSERLQKLYRDAAKRFHPDLAEDDLDRAWRTMMMQTANAAYTAGDIDALQQLLDEDRSQQLPTVKYSPEIEVFKDKTKRARVRLAEVLRQQMELETSDIGLLYMQSRKSGHSPADFVRELVAALRVEINEKRNLLNELLETENYDERNT
jgi:hypothetical protein